MRYLQLLTAFSLFITSITCQAFNLFFWHHDKTAQYTQSFSKIDTILARTQNLNPKVLSLALIAYHKLHQEGYDSQQMLTIVDYSKPSTEKRLWVINLKDLQVPFHSLVAQGANTGRKWARNFSDTPESRESSIGVYLTGNTYLGKHGYSLRLNGLEPGFNDKARMREIVMHAANYVNSQFVEAHGYLGRSWGCFALNPKIASQVITNIKKGTVLFAYYPETSWLKGSTYLQPYTTAA